MNTRELILFRDMRSNAIRAKTGQPIPARKAI
jgi:hypothetical protein